MKAGLRGSAGLGWVRGHRGADRPAGRAGRCVGRRGRGRCDWGIIGYCEDIDFDDPRLDEFAAAIDRDTSALVLVGEEETLIDFGTVIEPFGGEVIDTNLDEKDIKALRKALKN